MQPLIKTATFTKKESKDLNYHTHTAAAYGTSEHELNLTAMQTSEVDPNQQNGRCVRFGNLSHNKLVNV